MIQRSFALLALTFTLLLGCQQVKLPESRQGPAKQGPGKMGQMHRGPMQGGGRPAKMADDMDKRTPLFVLPMMAVHQKENMRDHLLAVQEIVEALSLNDFAKVSVSAARLGSSDGMTQQCNHMGAATPGFAELALDFHSTADGITVAADKKDSAGVMRALGETLLRCNGCHATYKHNIVDRATWTERTGMEPPNPGAMRHGPGAGQGQ